MPLAKWYKNALTYSLILAQLMLLSSWLGLIAFDTATITVFANTAVLVGAGDIAVCGSEKYEH